MHVTEPQTSVYVVVTHMGTGGTGVDTRGDASAEGGLRVAVLQVVVPGTVAGKSLVDTAEDGATDHHGVDGVQVGVTRHGRATRAEDTAAAPHQEDLADRHE